MVTFCRVRRMDPQARAKTLLPTFCLSVVSDKNRIKFGFVPVCLTKVTRATVELKDKCSCVDVAVSSVGSVSKGLLSSCLVSAPGDVYF